jgi:dGTPase
MAKRSRARAGNKSRALYREADWTRLAPSDIHKREVEPYRTPFRRDCQRVLHSPAFRRLQGKTQLFPSHEHDFYRTRLTHSLEVAQVAKSIAVRLNSTDPYFEKQPIDVDLVECAALSHDLGHPPFGHNGEYILDTLMMNHGGFEGNAQTFRILSKLEKKATTERPARTAIVNNQDARAGLNLTLRALAAVLKYDRAIPQTEAERRRAGTHDRPLKGYYSVDRPLVQRIKDALSDGPVGRFKTLECSIMDVADDIAYSTYDIEDAFGANFLNPISILTTDDSIKVEIAAHIKNKLAEEFSELPAAERSFSINELNAGLMSVFASILELDAGVFGRPWRVENLAAYVGGEVHRASTLLAKSSYHRTQFSSDLIGYLITKVEVSKQADNPVFWQVRPTLDAFGVIESLKMICITHLIQSDKFLADRRRARHIIKNMFEALIESGSDLLPADWRIIYNFYRDDEIQKWRTICDFIAGMTNRYCIEFHERLFGIEAPSIHKP